MTPRSRMARAADMILYGALSSEMGRMWSKAEMVSTFLGTRATRPEAKEGSAEPKALPPEPATHCAAFRAATCRPTPFSSASACW